MSCSTLFYLSSLISPFMQGSHGFNFLAYYMDHEKILPSSETIRRFFERSSALYEHSPTQPQRRRYKKNGVERDLSEYYVNEPAPIEADLKRVAKSYKAMALKKPDRWSMMRRYLSLWANWVRGGLQEISAFKTSVETYLPTLFSFWEKSSELSADSFNPLAATLSA